MISKTFIFSKLEKSISTIENRINEFLVDNDFKISTQNESTVKGKFIVTIFADETKAGKLLVKGFKDQDARKVDEAVTAFVQEHGMKFVTQTFVGSSIYTLVYYPAGKDTKVTPPADTTTPPATT